MTRCRPRQFNPPLPEGAYRAAGLFDDETFERMNYRRMYEDGLDKAARGVTTVEEVLRAVPLPDLGTL